MFRSFNVYGQLRVIVRDGNFHQTPPQTNHFQSASNLLKDPLVRVYTMLPTKVMNFRRPLSLDRS